MKMEIDFLEYNENEGIQFNWEKGYTISASINNNEIMIRANSAGLVSLAKQLLTLAQENVPFGSHIHLDEYNSLEDGSIELLIEKSDI